MAAEYAHLYKRMDELGSLAEEYLQDIPTEYDDEQLKGDNQAYGSFCLYKECIVLIDVLKSEIYDEKNTNT